MARGQFDYPEKSWAEGKMRKRGDQYAKMDRLQRDLPGQGGMLTEMDRAAGMSITARGGTNPAAGGGPTGTTQVPAAIVPTQKYAAETIAQHKDFIKENLNEVAQGSLAPDLFKRILKQFGWEGNTETGEFKDPNGGTHRIEAEAK